MSPFLEMGLFFAAVFLYAVSVAIVAGISDRIGYDWRYGPETFLLILIWPVGIPAALFFAGLRGTVRRAYRLAAGRKPDPEIAAIEAEIDQELEGLPVRPQVPDSGIEVGPHRVWR